VPKKKPALQIGCVYYVVNDMERAVRFYTRTLGLPLVVRYANDWAEVDAGSTRIGLHPTDDGKEIARGGGTVSFYVDNLKSLATRLKKKGVEFSPIHDTPRGPMAMMKDSEGNWLHVSQFSKSWVKANRYPLPRR